MKDPGPLCAVQPESLAERANAFLGVWWGKAEKCCLLEGPPCIGSHCGFQSQGYTLVLKAEVGASWGWENAVAS